MSGVEAKCTDPKMENYRYLKKEVEDLNSSVKDLT